jgi:hypothetical protein
MSPDARGDSLNNQFALKDMSAKMGVELLAFDRSDPGKSWTSQIRSPREKILTKASRDLIS